MIVVERIVESKSVVLSSDREFRLLGGRGTREPTMKFSLRRRANQRKAVIVCGFGAAAILIRVTGIPLGISV